MLYNFMQNGPKDQLWASVVICFFIVAFLWVRNNKTLPAKVDRTSFIVPWVDNDTLSGVLMITLWAAPTLILLAYGATAIDLWALLSLNGLVFILGSLVVTKERPFSVERVFEYVTMVITHCALALISLGLIALGGAVG